jgi:ethanolamine utilization microcompartment shell protein EutS
MSNASNSAVAPYTAIGIETITPSISGGCAITTATCSGYVNGGQQDIYAYMVTGGTAYVRELIRKKGTRGALQAEYSRVTRGIRDDCPY